MTTTSIDELFAAWSPLWDPPLAPADAPDLAPHVEFVGLEMYEEKNLQPQDDIAMQDAFGGGPDTESNRSVDHILECFPANPSPIPTHAASQNTAAESNQQNGVPSHADVPTAADHKHSQRTPHLPQVSPDRITVPIVSPDDEEGGWPSSQQTERDALLPPALSAVGLAEGRSISATAGSGDRGGPALLVPVPDEQQEGREEGQIMEDPAQASALQPAVEIMPRRAPSSRPLQGPMRALMHALDAVSKGSRGSPGMSPRNRLAAGADGGGTGARQLEQTPRTERLGSVRARDSPETPAADTRTRKQGRQTIQFASRAAPTRELTSSAGALLSILGACPQVPAEIYALVRQALVCCFPSHMDLMMTLRTEPVGLAATDPNRRPTRWEGIVLSALRKVA
uniref:Uncharacterized protein n=1 Tax=Mycena chlorophos TaxID=658473 RepID=A0ABQ0LCQ1_MYCCL|nr:predicted protein [Mycena chlorophos]